MGRARSAQASFEFGSSGSGAAPLPIEMGQTWGRSLWHVMTSKAGAQHSQLPGTAYAGR